MNDEKRAMMAFCLTMCDRIVVRTCWKEARCNAVKRFARILADRDGELSRMMRENKGDDAPPS